VCHDTGYIGREGIYEVLVVNEAIREAISAKKSAIDIEKIATDGGMKSMFENGLEKVKKGVTTVDELLRVISEG
jgi:type II secretory ATPase GspE/PulE/Tfp pilus assembly ATPase PilB-like protein